MPVLRDRSKIVTKRQAIVEETFNTKWSLSEKKKLLIALRKFVLTWLWVAINTEKDRKDTEKTPKRGHGHQPDDFTEIRKYLPHRTEDEIKWFINRMKIKGCVLNLQKPRKKVPIELWIQMAEDLTNHDVDCSYILAETFTKIGEVEQHDSKINPEDPDWKMIYNFVVALLRGDETPEVGQIEAAVLLDLTEKLVINLKSLETTDQRLLLQRKYDHLCFRIAAGIGEETIELTRKALETDLLELERSAPAPSVSTSYGNPDVKSANNNNSMATSSTSQMSTNHLPTPSRPTNCDPQDRATSSRLERPQLLVKSQLDPMYSINPFCIPIKYLNPTYRQYEQGLSNGPSHEHQGPSHEHQGPSHEQTSDHQTVH